MRVLKSVTLDPTAIGPAASTKESGGKAAAEVMEQRRMQRSASTYSRGSVASDSRSESGRRTIMDDSILEEILSVREKLDNMASQMNMCLQDTQFLRSVWRNPPVSSAAPPQSLPPRSPPCPSEVVETASHCSQAPDDGVDSSVSVYEMGSICVARDDNKAERLSASSSRGRRSHWATSEDFESEGKPSPPSERAEESSPAPRLTLKTSPFTFEKIDSHSSSGDDQEIKGSLKRAGSMPWEAIGTQVNTMFYTVRKRDERVRKMWRFLENPGTVRGSLVFARFVSLLIFVSSFLTFLQTGDSPPIDETIWFGFEVSFDIIFILEVVIRFIVCPDRVTFVFNPYNIIDILACVAVTMRTFVADVVDETERSQALWILTLSFTVPILRLLKLLRRFETFHLITKAFRLASEALPVLMFILSILVLIFASASYIVEPRSNIESLPRALWFTIVTVGTVGYGDIVPLSTAGSIVVSLLIVISALYMAIPIGIVGKAFSAVWEERDVVLLMHRTRARFEEHGYKATDVPAMFCSFDHNADGELDFQEFMQMMEYLQIDLGGDRLLDLFSSFDFDNSGAIDDREFVRTLFPSAYTQLYGKSSTAQEPAPRWDSKTNLGESGGCEERSTSAQDLGCVPSPPASELGNTPARGQQSPTNADKKVVRESSRERSGQHSPKRISGPLW